jgi:omega-amidase
MTVRRFPELALAMARHPRDPADLLVFPGAFNMTTGPLHWELLARARAVDTQLPVAVCSPARDVGASYVAWGHSMVSDARGQVIGALEEKDDVLLVKVDPEVTRAFREAIPTARQKRFDLYNDARKDE